MTTAIFILIGALIISQLILYRLQRGYQKLNDGSYVDLDTRIRLLAEHLDCGFRYNASEPRTVLIQMDKPTKRRKATTK